MFYQPTDKSVCICILVENARVLRKGCLAVNTCRTKETICIQIKVYHLSLPMPVVHSYAQMHSKLWVNRTPLTVLFADWYRPKRRFHHIRGESQREVHSQAETEKEKTENHSKVQWENVSFLFMVLGMKWILSLEKMNTGASQPNEH